MKDICDITCISEKEVLLVKSKMLSESVFYGASDIFKTLGDKTRLRILFALSKKELCVCDLCSLLSMEQSAISHHLRILKAVKLAKYRKDGKIVYYSLKDAHVIKLINVVIRHINE